MKTVFFILCTMMLLSDIYNFYKGAVVNKIEEDWYK